MALFVVTPAASSTNLSSTGEILVATFSADEGDTNVADYGATIAWGDPIVSSGLIRYDSASGIFSVYGSNSFDQLGVVPFTVTISHDNSVVGSATGSVTVSAAVTTVSLASPTSVIYGQAETLTATVMGYSNPTGTVTFYSSTGGAVSELGIGTLSMVDGQDIATLTSSSLTVSSEPYAITAVYDGDSDNQSGTSSVVNQTINPAALTVTVNGTTTVYGAGLPSFSASYSGFVNEDTSASLTTLPSFSTTASASSGVGSYSITASGAVDANYTINYVGGSLAVTPAALTITVNGTTTVYGAGLPSFSASYSGFVNGDTSASLTTLPSFSTTAIASSGVGSYSITASGAVDANYTINYVGGSLAVTPAALTITANGASKVYGARSRASPPFTWGSSTATPRPLSRRFRAFPQRPPQAARSGRTRSPPAVPSMRTTPLTTLVDHWPSRLLLSSSPPMTRPRRLRRDAELLAVTRDS